MEVINGKNVVMAENILGASDVVTDKKTKEKRIEREEIRKPYIWLLFKRIIDLTIGLVGTILLIPITLIVWIMKKINKEDGPVFYTQLRVGKNGNHFKIYKYRTMVIGADKKLQEYLDSNSDAKKEWEETRKLENDPRITKTGRFLRETSLDELPQLINLLNGTMSLIGPRPIIDEEMCMYNNEDERKKFLSVKPGITGYWAVNRKKQYNL